MTNGRIRLFCAAAVLLAAASASAQTWQLPLNMTELWGQGGQRFISGGVPLLVGQAKDLSELRLAARDREGKLAAVPAQFRELARWWRADNSLRWVLVDCQATFGGFDTRSFVLTNEKLDQPAHKTPVTVAEQGDLIVVNTGPARFTLNTKRFAFLQSAVIDGQELLATTPDCGTVMEDTLGNRYYGSDGTRTVTVLESGPLRAQVRARGQNMPRDGQGYSKGMYGYDTIMNFYAGSTDVYVDLVLTNNPPQSTGEPTFEDASLMMKLAGGANGYRLYGAAPLDGRLAGGESVCLYQDSNGADTWQRAQGDFSDTRTVSFRGYKVLKRAGGQESVVTQGDRARGLAHFFNDAGGLIVHTRNFWQQFPKAVEGSADGTVRLALWPREAPVPQYLEDAGAKGHEVVLHFYKLKSPTGYAAEGGRTWPHVFADCWDYPVYPRPAIEHIAATGALTDLGPFSVPESGYVDYALEVNERRRLMTDRYWGNGYGWLVLGSRWQAHGGHSSRGARQPMKEDHFLYSYYVTGGKGWLEEGNNRSRHFRDVRSYRIEEQDPFGFKNWEAFRKANRSEDYCNRPQPRDEEIQKYSQGRWKRSTWWLPNPAHMTLDLVYDRYLLFGDQRAFENLPIIAGHGGNFSAYNRAYVHRDTGWTWRALTRYWELTGDKDAEQCLKDTIRNHSVLIGKTPLVCGTEAAGGGVNWWFTQVYSRAVAMTALHTGDPQALELVKTLCVDKESRAEYFCMLFAVAYHLTGEQKYKDAVMKVTDNGRRLLVVRTDGDWPATAHWLLHQPPRTR